MEPTARNILKSSWLKNQIELMQKGRLRRYLHFDKVIKNLDKAFVNKITDPSYIKHHSFFPLIQRIQSNRLYKKDSITKEREFKRKDRTIAYASHEDSFIYSWYTKQLEENYEKILGDEGISDSVIAYRKLGGKSNVDFAKEVFDEIKSKPECATINLDIEGFFDNLDHGLLKRRWMENLNTRDLPADHYAVYKSVVNYSYVRMKEVKKLLKLQTKYDNRNLINLSILNTLRTSNKIKKNKKLGIPQGLPISCVLSNMYMLDIDSALNKKLETTGGLYRRYSDDLVIICPPDKVEDMCKFVSELVSQVKLNIQPSKTEFRYFKIHDGQLGCFNEEGKPSKFQYLGVEFDGSKTFLRHKGYAKYERKMATSIKKEFEASEEDKRPMRKKKLYERYSHLGKRNYLTYAYRAVKKLKSLSIMQQVEKTKVMRKIQKKIMGAKIKGKNPTS